MRRWIQHCWDNGSVTNRWQSIIYANDGLVYWHIQASLGSSELMWCLCVITWFMWKYSHSWINMVVGDGLACLVPRHLQPSWIHDDVSCFMHIKSHPQMLCGEFWCPRRLFYMFMIQDAALGVSSLPAKSSAQKSHVIIGDLGLFASERNLLMAAMW